MAVGPFGPVTKTVTCPKCGIEGPLWAEMVGGTLRDPILKYYVKHPRVSKANPRPTRRVIFHELVGYSPAPPATVMDKLEQAEAV